MDRWLPAVALSLVEAEVQRFLSLATVSIPSWAHRLQYLAVGNHSWSKTLWSNSHKFMWRKHIFSLTCSLKHLLLFCIFEFCDLSDSLTRLVQRFFKDEVIYQLM
jgi:hypothetical protein